MADIWAALTKPYLAAKPAPEVIEKVVEVTLREEVPTHFALAPAATSTSFGKHVPQPGTAVVEVYNASNSLIAMDTVEAPSTGLPPDLEVTTVVVPAGPQEFKHYEFRCAAEHLPFPLPPHLARPGASYYKVWWAA